MRLSLELALERLAPILPDQVQTWRRGLQQGSAGLQRILERHIRRVYDETFRQGDLLIPPPPKSKFRRGFRLGDIQYAGKWGPYGITKDVLLQNVGIFGRSGGGKTNIALLLLEQLLASKIPFVFFDWKRTCRDLLPKWKGTLKVFTPGRKLLPFQFDFLSPPQGLERAVWNRQVIDVISRAYTLGDGAKSLLSTAMNEVGEHGTISTVIKFLKGMEVKGRQVGWHASATRAMESLNQETEISESASPISTRELLGNHTVLELDSLSANYKKTLIPLLSLSLLYAMLHSGRREKLNMVIFIEEAHHILHGQGTRGSESVMEMLMRQCREVGIGMVVIDQHPHLISPAVLGNTALSICFNLKDPRDVRKASEISQLTEHEREYVGKLPVGCGVVKDQASWPKPFIVNFNHQKIDKGSVPDENLRTLSSRRSSLSLPSPPSRSEREGEVRSRALASLDMDAFGLAYDVIKNPQDGVDRRYKRLGWSCSKGTRIKRACIRSSMMAEQKMEVGKTRRIILRVNGEPGRVLGNIEAARPESIAHWFWKREISAKLRQAGFAVTEEFKLPTGRVDILGKRHGNNMAIEIETGKSNAVANVQKCLAAGLPHVHVVVVKRSALASVERKLAQAGLMIPGRVKLQSASEFLFGSEFLA